MSHNGHNAQNGMNGHHGPNLAQARPLRSVTVPGSFQIEAVDATAEQTVGHDFRQHRREQLGIPDDRSLLHPDRPKFPAQGPIQQPQPPVGGQQPLPPQPPPNNTATGVPDGSLGIALSKFVGTFQGNGFNTILRPQNGPNGQGLSDNLLELNFTHETLSFLSENVLGNVPNRGSNLQPDLNLRGIPYTQQIKDLANGATGKADLPLDKAPGIHFEQGLFMRTPALIPWKDNTFTAKGPAILGASITRMGSIPHGTTINCQSLDPTQTLSGAPKFDAAGLKVPKILPFPLGQDPVKNALTVFPQTHFEQDVLKDRIPLNLRDFAKAGTINQDEFNNPENFLKENNDKKNIIEHVTFKVDSKPRLDLWGGGTDNSAHPAEHEIKDASGQVSTNDAEKTGTSTANANAIQVTCQYWISTVEDTITIPVFDKATLPRINSSKDQNDPDNIVWKVVSPSKTAGVNKPDFKIMLDKNATEFKAAVRYTQIQYSQNVTLNFGTLSWPHISVASLVPADPVQIKSDRDFKKV